MNKFWYFYYGKKSAVRGDIRNGEEEKEKKIRNDFFKVTLLLFYGVLVVLNQRLSDALVGLL